MKPADQYSISFPYGATSYPYGTPAYPFHRGDDRACPTGTPIIVEGMTIGLTGATGKVTGPHLHTQEWRTSMLNTRKPQNAFKGGIVTQATSGGDFGNYVTIQTSDGWNDSYCHLSRIDVKVGDIIGGSMEPTWNEGDAVNFNVWHYGKDLGKFREYIGQKYKDAVGNICTSGGFKTDQFFNEGDVSEMQGVLGTSNAASQVGKDWKDVWHDYTKKNIPKGAPVGTYLRVDKSDIMEVK